MADIVSRLYSNFRGVDFRSDEGALQRSPDSLNMWKDYKQANSIRTRPSLKRIFPLDVYRYVHSISFYKGMLMVHHDTMIYAYDPETKKTTPIGEVSDLPSQTFVFNDVWYFKQKGCFKQFNERGGFVDVVGFVPTTTKGKKPSGGGTVFQDVNMLTRKRKNTFLADEKSKVYHLDSSVLPDTEVIVTVNDAGSSPFAVDYDKGTITFVTAPEKPITDGQDNVVVEFYAPNDHSDKILGCTLVQLFDNRVFFSGNPDYPNMVWHSSLDDPTYVSDLDYYQEGRDEAPVRGMVAGNNALWVFREPSDEQTTVFYHVPTIDDQYGKIYPATHSSISTGCVGKAINFNDDIVFFSERGMEGISGDITTEQVIAHRSSLVDRKLTAEPGYKDMVLAEWEGYLLTFVGNKVYLADSRAMFNNENHLEYDWFYWEIDVSKVTCALVHNGVLYIGTAFGGVLALTGEDPVESYWVTTKDKFKYPHKLKTTNKRGCVVEATGDFSVYAKIEDTDFELIGEHKNVTDYFVSRIKRKKFKDIQLKFHSNTRFSLETITLESFIGGYIKR